MARTALLACAPLLLLGSCLQLEERITIHPDGSGTQKLRMRITDEMLATVRRASSVVDASVSRSDPLEVFERESVTRELRRAGLTLRAHHVDDRRRVVEVEAAFDNLAQLRASPLLGRKAEWLIVEGRTPATRHLVLYPRGRAAWLQARREAAGLAEAADDERRRKLFESRRAKLRGLGVRLEIELPGDVIACSKNLTRTGPRTVAATVEASDLHGPRDLVLALAPRYEVAFDARGCTFPVDGKIPVRR